MRGRPRLRQHVGGHEVSTLNLGEKLILRAGSWGHKQQFGSVYASQDGKQPSNLLFANWRSDWSRAPRLALLGHAGFDRNEFAGISRRVEEALGLAGKLAGLSHEQWSIEAGLALNQQRAPDSTSRNFASVRSATTYKHSFSKAAYFVHAVEFLPSVKVSTD